MIQPGKQLRPRHRSNCTFIMFDSWSKIPQKGVWNLTVSGIIRPARPMMQAGFALSGPTVSSSAGTLPSCGRQLSHRRNTPATACVQLPPQHRGKLLALPFLFAFLRHPPAVPLLPLPLARSALHASRRPNAPRSTSRHRSQQNGMAPGSFPPGTLVGKSGNGGMAWNAVRGNHRILLL